MLREVARYFRKFFLFGIPWGKGREATMLLNKKDKRDKLRIKREFVIGVRTRTGMKVAYAIDVSREGVKVGSPQLTLPVGELVEVMVEKGGEKIPFSGQVARDDGPCHLDRIGRSANSFFIRITDARFPEFAFNNYYV